MIVFNNHFVYKLRAHRSQLFVPSGHRDGLAVVGNVTGRVMGGAWRRGDIPWLMSSGANLTLGAQVWQRR
jgi:hypothetical protein